MEKSEGQAGIPACVTYENRGLPTHNFVSKKDTVTFFMKGQQSFRFVGAE